MFPEYVVWYIFPYSMEHKKTHWQFSNDLLSYLETVEHCKLMIFRKTASLGAKPKFCQDSQEHNSAKTANDIATAAQVPFEYSLHG